MHDDVEAAITGCTAAHRRLAATLETVDDGTARRPSLLPDWTVGHVLTHLARNAESHVRMLEAALVGQAVEQYTGGDEQRRQEIEAGAHRGAEALRSDVRHTSAALEAAWARMDSVGWSGHGLTQGAEWPCRLLPFHRWREVEIHHVDLGLAYGPSDWPDGYVRRDLPVALATVPDRLAAKDRAGMLAWLVGRAGPPAGVQLAPWAANGGTAEATGATGAAGAT